VIAKLEARSGQGVDPFWAMAFRKGWHAARTAREAALEPVHGDVLPPVGADVLIRLASEDAWLPHVVTGYYVWPSLDGDARRHRVFVRVKDADGTPNARMLCDLRRPDGTPYVTGKATGPSSEPAEGPAVAWEYRNQHGNPFLTHKDPAKWHPHDLAGFKDFRALGYLSSGKAPKGDEPFNMLETAKLLEQANAALLQENQRLKSEAGQQPALTDEQRTALQGAINWIDFRHGSEKLILPLKALLAARPVPEGEPVTCTPTWYGHEGEGACTTLRAHPVGRRKACRASCRRSRRGNERRGLRCAARCRAPRAVATAQEPARATSGAGAAGMGRAGHQRGNPGLGQLRVDETMTGTRDVCCVRSP
jgi:hypothetical protein